MTTMNAKDQCNADLLAFEHQLAELKKGLKQINDPQAKKNCKMVFDNGYNLTKSIRDMQKHSANKTDEAYAYYSNILTAASDALANPSESNISKIKSRIDTFNDQAVPERIPGTNKKLRNLLISFIGALTLVAGLILTAFSIKAVATGVGTVPGIIGIATGVAATATGYYQAKEHFTIFKKGVRRAPIAEGEALANSLENFPKRGV